MKIDLHAHCSERSGCGRSTEEEMVQAAIAAGLDALAFTDHGTLQPEANRLLLNKQFAPFRVFGGIERTIEGEDFIILGIQDDRLELESFTYPQLHAFVREQGGYFFLAHPFRYRDFITPDIETDPPDGIELLSVNTPKAAADRIRELAGRLNLHLLCNSDGHIDAALGYAYNILDGAPDDDASLVAALRKGFGRFPEK